MDRQERIKRSTHPSPTHSTSFLQTRPFAASSHPSIQQTSTHSTGQPSFRLDTLPLFSPVPPAVSTAPPIQAKLTIGEPNDKYEQEADRVAAQVVQRIHSPQAAQSNSQTDVAQANPEEDASEGGTVQRQTDAIGLQQASQFRKHVRQGILQRSPVYPLQRSTESSADNSSVSQSISQAPANRVQRVLPILGVGMMRLMQNPTVNQYAMQQGQNAFNYMQQQGGQALDYTRSMAQQYPQFTQFMLNYGQERLEDWAGRDARNAFNMFQHMRGRMSDEDFYDQDLD